MPTVTIYTTRFCPYCVAAKTLLNKKHIAFSEIDVTGNPDGRSAMTQRAHGRTTVPQIFIGDRHLGGCDDLYDLDSSGQLDSMLTANA